MSPVYAVLPQNEEIASVIAVKHSYLSLSPTLIQRVRPLNIWPFVVVRVQVIASYSCAPLGLGFTTPSDCSSSFLSRSSTFHPYDCCLNAYRNMPRIGHLSRHDYLRQYLTRPHHHVNNKYVPPAHNEYPPTRIRHWRGAKLSHLHSRHRHRRHSPTARASPR